MKKLDLRQTAPLSYNTKTILHLLVFSVLLCCIASQAEAKNRSVIIGYKNTLDSKAQSFLVKKRARIKKRFRHINAIVAEVPEESLVAIMSDTSVAYVEEDFPISLVDQVQESVEYDNSWGVSHIGAESVHQLPVTGYGVKIAILDTGIDYNHPELADNYQGGIDFVFSDDDPFDDSWNSHGSHVAGIIAAAKDDVGVIGVAPDASLYAVKILDGSGMGTASWLISGLEWAVANDMDIANISVGFSQYSQAIEDACTYASENGVLLVAAAGNTSGGEVTYPAAFASVIAVTGTDPQDQSGYFAPLGPEVELAAPGLAIYSTTRNETYTYLSGTSQAAPHVSGAAALLLEAGLQDFNKDRVINNADLRHRLIATATDLGIEGRDEEFGYGLINIARAVDVTPSPDEDFISFILERQERSPMPREKIILQNGIFEAVIINNSLRNVIVLARQDGKIRADLSSHYRFNDTESPQEAILTIDASNITLDITFIGIGKAGSSAEVNIASVDDE
ncbi:MAG: S8 family peptidase [Desulfobulbaceae bacterium]|nr:S8 family peptidase [Desulfobulbaceae bacterium]